MQWAPTKCHIVADPKCITNKGHQADFADSTIQLAEKTAYPGVTDT